MAKDLLLLSDRMDIQRYYTHDSNNLIGSDQESGQLREEMRRELVQQLAMRLQLITPERLDQLQTEAEAKAKAEADALEAERRAEEAKPQQSPLQLPVGARGRYCGPGHFLPMKLNAAQLSKHLQGNLAPVYIVSGDELLCQEACDAIRTACRERDFNERQVFNVEASFDWGNCMKPAPASRCSPTSA